MSRGHATCMVVVDLFNLIVRYYMGRATYCTGIHLILTNVLILTMFIL